MLHSIAEVRQMIVSGKSLFLAGSAASLAKLPAGNWIGGSIPYFMDVEGGVCTEDRVFVTEVPTAATNTSICEYTPQRLSELYRDAPVNGFSFLLIPNQSPFLETFARDASECEEYLLKPVVGWVTGVAVSAIGKEVGTVVDGRTLTSSTQDALVMHVSLPATLSAEVEIINIFKQGTGDALTFPESGFSAGECLVNGKVSNFAQYIASKQIDTQLPLTADYSGSILNVSIQSVDLEAGKVHFYAPVFNDIQYYFADPVGDYTEAIPDNGEALFSCNCILNYLYGKLEGHHTGGVTGPITFGEIAHQLLNQTLVQLRIRNTA